jgi:hypothetical protein
MRQFLSTTFATALLIGASALAMAQTAAPGTGASPPAASSGAVSTMTPGVSGAMKPDTSGATLPGANRAVQNEAQVTQQLKASGYSNVQDVHKSGDGWVAKAIKNGKQVSLNIDNSGKIQIE